MYSSIVYTTVLLAASGIFGAIANTWSGFRTGTQNFAIGATSAFALWGILSSFIPTYGVVGTLYDMVYARMVSDPILDRWLDAGMATLSIDAIIVSLIFYGAFVVIDQFRAHITQWQL